MRLGVSTLADLLLYLPYRYVDRSRQSRIADLGARAGRSRPSPRFADVNVVPGRRPRFVLVLEDESGALECVWFAGHRYLRQAFAPGDLLAVGGKVTRFGRKRQMVHPDVEVISERDDGNAGPYRTRDTRLFDNGADEGRATHQSRVAPRHLPRAAGRGFGRPLAGRAAGPFWFAPVS